MTKHTHDFVETYDGLVGFGLDRDTDEKTVAYYLQKLSDDEMMRFLLPKMSARELEEVFSLVSRLLRDHLSEPEYHRFFLKEAHPC
jgi:hypothetical protein